MMKAQRGFSLIEMALVLMVVTLLLGGLLVPFATQVEQRRIAETQKAMEEIKEALIGYALSHSATVAAANGTLQPYLPCPDTTGDGQEDRSNAGLCIQDFGNLPWATLGTAPADAWGNRFHYSVDPLFSGRANGFALTTGANLAVCDRAVAGGPCAQSVATGIPAIVLSYGKNGYGARNANGGLNQAPPNINIDEIENTSADADLTFFVSRIPIPASNPCGGAGQPLCEFDDLVVWLSPNVLFNRMVAAGRLP